LIHVGLRSRGRFAPLPGNRTPSRAVGVLAAKRGDAHGRRSRSQAARTKEHRHRA
jgi:hypothetical protein